MVESISGGGAASASLVAANDGPKSAGDLINEALSWASPDGLLLHAVQPIAAEALRRSDVGQGTAWGKSLQAVLDSPAAVRGFQAGFREGVWNGAKSLVSGALDLAKLGVDLGPVGAAADGLRHLGVSLPAWAPSTERAQAKIGGAATAIAHYVGEVAGNPAKLGNDVKGWIAANWNGLKADHARAAAQGPEAEAKWWGQIAGRATFEVAAIVVPVTKFATVAKAGEALEVALKAGKLGEAFADAARVGKLGELFGAAVKGGKVAELVGEARNAGRLTELLVEARKTPGGLEAIAPHVGEVGSTGAKLTGARHVLNPTTIQGWEKAEGVYNAIRTDATDIASIAKNTGWSEKDIARVKDHLFIKEHRLDEGVRRFDADPDIVNAWDRMKRGDHVASDIDLLRHELFESRFEATFRTDYRTAHDATLRAGRTWKGE